MPEYMRAFFIDGGNQSQVLLYNLVDIFWIKLFPFCVTSKYSVIRFSTGLLFLYRI